MKRNEDEINVRLWCREGLEGDGNSLASRFTEGITGERQLGRNVPSLDNSPRNLWYKEAEQAWCVQGITSRYQAYVHFTLNPAFERRSRHEYTLIDNTRYRQVCGTSDIYRDSNIYRLHTHFSAHISTIKRWN